MVRVVFQKVCVVSNGQRRRFEMVCILFKEVRVVLEVVRVVSNGQRRIFEMVRVVLEMGGMGGNLFPR